MVGVGRRWKREKVRLEGWGEGEEKRGGKVVEAGMDAMAVELASLHARFHKEAFLPPLLNVGWLPTYRVRICSSDISDYLLYRIRICFSSHMISDYLLSLVPGQQWTKSVATANGLLFLFGDKHVLHLKFIDKI